MSETVHYKGKLIPTRKPLTDFAVDKDDFCDKYYKKAIVIDGLVYMVDKTDIDPATDIFKASINADGSIDFEVKYYNGGCGFSEAINAALKFA